MENIALLMLTYYYPSGRRAPTYFTSGQREVMEAHFNHDNFPEPGEQMAIAHQLGIDYPVVKTWFQNTRKNIRKMLKEEGMSFCTRWNRNPIDSEVDNQTLYTVQLTKVLLAYCWLLLCMIAKAYQNL